MITYPPILHPRKKYPQPKPTGTNSPTPPAALTLIAGSYEESYWVRLTFDRPVDVSGLDGTQITIDDGTYGLGLYDATGTVTMIDPSTVRIMVGYLDESHNPGVFLTATALTGIVAVDDGGTWPGVTHVGLPF